MTSRTARCLALLLLAVSGTLMANNPFEKKCDKGDCESCESGSCEPTSKTYQSETGFTTEQKAHEDPEEECKGRMVNNYDGGPGAPGAPGGDPGGPGPGVTAKNYSRANLLLLDVSPDYVKTETINGIRTPKYLPIKQGGYHIKDLPDGFEIVKYPSSQLAAPAANGIRAPKPDAQASSITAYRNPDGGTATTSGNLDIVHKQRHPQTGAWITRTTRIHAPQDNTAWTTRFYLGDPKENPTLQPYRKITITRTPGPENGTETTREVTKDRDTSGTLVTTSDLTRTYAFYKHGEPVILSETRHTGTGSELATGWTYFKFPADQASFNKPATMRCSDGQWSNTTYLGNPITGTLVTKTVSGWFDNPAPAIGTAPDENANRVVIEFEAKNETGTIGREEKIQGVTVSRIWGNRYKSKSGETVEKTHEQRGAATLTTIRTRYPNDTSVSAVERGRLKSIQHPDGTVTLHRHATQGENRVETIETGVGDLSAVTDGTRTVSTYTKDDILIKQVTSDIASAVELSARQAIAFDANDHPSRWAYDHNLDDYNETLNGCCGIDSTRSRDGVLTTYTRDGLKRPKTATSQGITLDYTYGSKDIGGTLFPTENITATAGGLILDQGTTVLDHAGNIIQQISPDLDGDGNPEITGTTRNFVTRTTTTTNPDGGTEIETDHADGQHKSTTGTAVPDLSENITVGTDLDGIPGAVRKTTTIRPSYTAAGDQITATYQAIGGLTLATRLNGVTTATHGYDEFARLTLTTDGDGVKQHTAYNAKGEAYRHATSRDGNDTIDPGTDTVSDTIRDITTVEGFGPAIRTRQLVWLTDTESRTLSATLQSPDGLTTRHETLGVSNPSITTRASHLDRADGAWTDTTVNPDGTKQVTEYSNWLAVSTSSLNTENSPLETASTTYDALRRPITRTYSRTGEVKTFYAPNGQVDHIDDHDRITRFKYDKMGNRVETTLPDNTKTYTVFSNSGQPIISWGSQTFPTYHTHDEQGRPLTLRTKPDLTAAGVPTDVGGSLTTWLYYPNGQLKQKLDAADKGAIHTYTPGGRRHTLEWARGVLITYGYNTAGEPISTAYSDTTPDVTQTFDLFSRLLTQSNGLATSVFTYDPATLALDKETISYDLNLDGTPDLTRVLDRSRDNLGRPTGFQLKDGTTIENQAAYGYNPTDGRLQTVADAASGSFQYSYVPNSHLIESVTGPIHTVINTWESTRNVLATKQNKAGTIVISQFDYTVNTIGQRTGVNTSGTAFPATPAWAWGYDLLGQLTSADHSTDNTFDRAYQFDIIGNRQRTVSGTLDINDSSATAYTANALNQYSFINHQQSTINPTYDLDGNATAYPVPAHPSGNSTLAWDAENRLVSATVNSAAISHHYDARSRKIATTNGENTTLYIYDNWNPIAEYTDTTLSKTRLWGIDLSDSMQDAGGVSGLLSESSLITSNPITFNSHFPTYDGNGNVSEYLDASGQIAAHFEYDPFGNTLANTNTLNQFTYRFSTKPLDPTTGLYYYGYRWYDPLTGRWPSRDPIEEEGGMNLYGFAGNDGINTYDVLGNASPALAALLPCIKGAVVSALSDLAIQYSLQCYHQVGWRIWRCDLSKCAPDYCSIAVSAAVGCATGYMPGSLPTSLAGLKLILRKIGAGSSAKWLGKLPCK